MSKEKKFNFKSKRVTRSIAFFATVVLVCTTLMTGIAFISDGFEKKPDAWFSTEVNPDNYIKLENYKIKNGQDDGNGIKYSVSDKGVIRLNGKATEDISIVLADVVLEAGTYTISGVDSCTNYGLVVDGANVDAKAGVTNDTFTLEQAATVTVSIYVNEGTFLLNKTIKPVLNKGDTPIDFYG